MADRIEVEVSGEQFDVSVFQRDGNRRMFEVPSIPLSCVVSRSGKPHDGELHFSVLYPAVRIPMQELYTRNEFNGVLADDQMASHARFVINQWRIQQAAEQATNDVS